MARTLVALAAMILGLACAANPLVPKVGMADPHAHVWASDPDSVYLYATHDCAKSPTGNCTVASDKLTFRMLDWWMWKSKDLVNWTQMQRVTPAQISYENVNTSTECWATDAASFPNGSTFWYLSVGQYQIGVVTGDSPSGPFTDPLGKPLVAEGDYPTYSRDPGILMDDDGANYIIFGTFSYFIAKLNEDMISLAEEAHPVKIINVQHKDDKPFLHKHNGTYYLSWGCFYAMGESPYGPFNYTGSIVDPDSLVNTTFEDGGGTTDRHGSFFEFHGQTYFACNDRSHGGSAAFRSTIISYVNYRRNGTIAPLRIDETGVGQYNASLNEGRIEAEDFFKIQGTAAAKMEQSSGDDAFEVVGLNSGSSLEYPHVTVGTSEASITLVISNGGSVTEGQVEVQDADTGVIYGSCDVPTSGAWDSYLEVVCGTLPSGEVDLIFSFSGAQDSEVFAHLDFFIISPASSTLA